MLRNGPVTTEFKCDDNFQVYKAGIMVQQESTPEKPPQGQAHAQTASVTNGTAQSPQAAPQQHTEAAAAANREDVLAPNHGDLEYMETQFSDVLSGSEESALKHEQPAEQVTDEAAPASPAQNLAQSQSQMAHQALDHTIFLVGWGVDKEKNTSYWIVRNSYGDSWGMRGDFHVRRGRDDFGVESELSAYQLELVK